MERSDYFITLDLQKNHAGHILTMKQNDTCRRIVFSFTDGGRPYPLQADCRGVFTAKTPAGTAIFNDCQRRDNTLIYDITAQTTGQPGQHSCEIRLYGADNTLLTAAAFDILVTAQVVDDDTDITPMPEATTLARLLDRVEQVTDFVDDTGFSDKAWSAQKLLETFCPAFSLTGNPVTCRPVAGYPLQVAAEGSITHLGKNLVGFADYSGLTSTNRVMSCVDGVHKSVFSKAVSTTWLVTNEVTQKLHNRYLPAGTYVFSVNQESNGYTYKNCYAVVTLADGTTVQLPEGETVKLTQPGQIAQFRCSSTSATAGLEIRFTLQIEAAQTPTGYEPYRGESVEPGVVAAYPGVNTFIAESGEITVSGRKDIVSILEGLENGN